MAKFGDKLQPASHSLHVAAECREQKITALFQAGNLVLTDAQCFRDAFLRQLVGAAKFAQRHLLGNELGRTARNFLTARWTHCSDLLVYRLHSITSF